MHVCMPPINPPHTHNSVILLYAYTKIGIKKKYSKLHIISLTPRKKNSRLNQWGSHLVVTKTSLNNKVI